MRQEFLETRKQATFSRRADRSDPGAAGEQRAGDGAAEPARVFELRRMPVLRGARAVHQLRADADLSPARPAAAVPLLRLCGEGAVASARSARASTSTFWARARSAWRTNCITRVSEARIARLDRDTVTGKRQFEDILQNFRERNFDILVGTQMIAKGHDIPNVTLVGVVSADVGSGHAGFPRGRANVSVADAGGGPRRARAVCRASSTCRPSIPDHYAVRLAGAAGLPGVL